jgi:hypothetical protein
MSPNKIPFENRLSVVRVKANFAGPYRKSPFFYMEREHLRSKQRFITHVRNIARSWPYGTYYLKTSTGQVFARFDISAEGEVRKLYKESPVTGKPYPVWDFFRK